MRISVAMCTYNGERFLQEQLDSISGQGRLPDELVVRDDGSSDGTLNILRRLAASARFPVRLSINEENMGSTKNFENAIAACSGDIIVLADQDDVWHPKKLSRIEKVFSSSPRTGAVFSDAEVVDENLHCLGYRLWEAVGFTPRMQRRFQRGDAVEVLLKCNVATGATMAFRAEHRKYVLPIPKSCVHDWWIALLSSFVGGSAIISEPLIKYRQHSANQIGGKRDRFSGKVEKAFRIGPAEFLSVATDYTFALDRVRSFSHVEDLSAIKKLEEKVNHFLTRSSYPKNPFLRFLHASGELTSKRYHNYSLGFRSFFKDLLYR